MLPDWVSNPGPLTYKSSALPTALRGPAEKEDNLSKVRVISLGDVSIHIQGPVVQSIVSLTSSLRGQLVKFLGLYNQIHCSAVIPRTDRPRKPV